MFPVRPINSPIGHQLEMWNEHGYVCMLQCHAWESNNFLFHMWCIWYARNAKWALSINGFHLIVWLDTAYISGQMNGITFLSLFFFSKFYYHVSSYIMNLSWWCQHLEVVWMVIRKDASLKKLVCPTIFFRYPMSMHGHRWSACHPCHIHLSL